MKRRGGKKISGSSPNLQSPLYRLNFLHTAGLLCGAGLFFGGDVPWSGPSHLRLAANKMA